MRFYAIALVTLHSTLACSADGSLRGSRSLSDKDEGIVMEDNDFGIMATENKYPAGNNADVLLQGFRIDGGVGSSPFDDISPCDDTVDSDDACFVDDVVPSEGSRHYDSLIKDSASRSSLLSSITKAQGGSMGISVSASASYVSEKSESSESISYMIGGHRYSNTKRVVEGQTSNLKLNEKAKKLLEKDPMRFLETYGDYYIKSVTYGGSFLGSYDLTMSSKADSDDLQVEASFKYKSGIYSAEGSSEFINRNSEETNNLQSFGDFNSIPGISWNETINAPANLTAAYAKWNTEVDESPAPLYVNIGRWFDSRDVQDVLNQLYLDDIIDDYILDLFTSPINIGQVTTIEATNESVGSLMLFNSLEAILEWDDVKNDNELTETGKELLKDVRSYSTACGQMDQYQLALLDTEIRLQKAPEEIDNIFGSWLHYKTSLAPRFESFMESIPEQSIPEDKKMDIYANLEAANTDTQNNRYRFLMSSTTLTEAGFEKGDSFCSPQIQAEDMKLMEVSNSVAPYNHKISSNDIEDGDIWKPRESFWVYDSPAEGLTQFFVWKSGRTDTPKRYRITTTSDPNGWEYSESFHARLPINGSCDRPTASPTKTPTAAPTVSLAPSGAPTAAPTASPTLGTTYSPTTSPTTAITASPTKASIAPTATPTNALTNAPTISPTTTSLTTSPTKDSIAPSASPTNTSTNAPTSTQQQPEPETPPPTSKPTNAPVENPDNGEIPASKIFLSCNNIQCSDGSDGASCNRFGGCCPFPFYESNSNNGAEETCYCGLSREDAKENKISCNNMLVLN